MPLDGGMTLLQRQIPFRQAMGMLLTGKRIRRSRALELGLVNEVVPRAELDAAVARWIDDDPRLRAAVAAGDQAGRAPDRHAVSRRRPRRCACPRWWRRCSREDADEGVRAFQQKRKPQWHGR